MKYILGILALATLAYAELEGNIDLSQLKIKRPIRRIDSDGSDKIEFEERIVGGDIVESNSIPYQAALIITGTYGIYLCGGTLVSPRHILTASHCLVGASQIEARLGAHYWNMNEVNQQRIFTTNYEIHPGYNPDLFINDIGVVILPIDVTLNEFVQLVNLPSFADVGNSFAGQLARLSGWGTIADNTDEASDNLRAVEAEVITNFFCNFAFLGGILPTHICTSGDGGVGGCHGDSGGPLVAGNKLIGIVTFALGLGCEVGWPTVYSRVTSFLDWIDEHTDANISRE